MGLTIYRDTILLFKRRITQFFIVYGAGLGFLLGLKSILDLSDYVIPGIVEIWSTGLSVAGAYLHHVLNTLSVAMIGQLLSIIMAFAIGTAARKSTWMGTFIKAAAYNIQAYPIVAVAPIIFILLGDGFASRLIIAAMICYFPLLLSVVSIMSEPITDIEHFYLATGRMRWQLEIKIRAFENIRKLSTVIAGSATLAMAGTIVAEFIAANAGIGHAIRIALYQSDLSKILAALFLIGICLSLYQGTLEWMGEKIIQKWVLVDPEEIP